MKLSKMAGGAAGSPYLWWAVTSQLLQARAAAAGALGCADPRQHVVLEPPNSLNVRALILDNGQLSKLVARLRLLHDSTLTHGRDFQASQHRSWARFAGQETTMKPLQLLQLAESIAAKQTAQAEAAGAPPSQDCVLLHCALLQAQGRHDAAVELLQGRAGAAFVMPAERRLIVAALLVPLQPYLVP